MKNKKIIDLCKKSRNVYIFNDEKNNCQWISDGFGTYPMLDMPTLNEQYICKLYDISDSQSDKITFRTFNSTPEHLCFDDTDTTEAQTKMLDISIIADGNVLLPIMTEEGLMFIKNQYLMPFTDVPKGEIQIFTRKGKNGQTVFAVKIGLLLYALIVPCNIISEEFVDKLEDLSRMSRLALCNQSQESGGTVEQ